MDDDRPAHLRPWSTVDDAQLRDLREVARAVMRVMTRPDVTDYGYTTRDTLRRLGVSLDLLQRLRLDP